VEWGNKREEDRDDMPEADSSADLEVNPHQRNWGVWKLCLVVGVDMGTDREQERMTDLLVLKTVLFLQVIMFCG
jgi:hypothetical protein